MAKIKYPGGPLERDHLRDALRRRGLGSVDDFAASFRERWGFGHLRSYRLAAELSLEQVCGQVNKILGIFSGETGYFTHTTLSKLERWPVHPRHPTVSHLVALAEVFGTTPRKLVAPSDWDKLPPADRFALRAYDRLSESRATDPGTTVGMMEEARPQAGGTPPTSPRWWAVSEPIRSGNPIEGLVTMTNDESTRYADRAGNTGPASLEQLRANTADLAGRFVDAPRLELFGGLRMLRDRIFAILDGGQPIHQRRDVYFLAAAACGMLATASNDLGYPAAGLSQAQVAHVFAAEAGDPALAGWLYAQQATICYWAGQPGKARDYARRGAATHPAGTVGVWLPAIEARASGELGDAEGVRTAVRRASGTRDTVQPGSLDQFGGIMSYNQAKQHFYAAGAYLGLGDDPAVITEANAALDAYQAGSDSERAYDNMAMVRFQAAIAQVRTGDLDAAMASATDALTVSTQHRNAQVDKTAKRLHRHLCTPAVRTVSLAVDTREAIEDFLTTTPAHPELS